MAKKEGVITGRFDSHAAMRTDQIASWQGQPTRKRFKAARELSAAIYLLSDPTADASRLQRTVERFERSRC